MIRPEQKEIANNTIDIALKKGCQHARVSLITGVNNSFEFRNKQLDKLNQSSENKLYIELYIDGRYGSFSTNRIDNGKEIEEFVEHNIASTKYLAVDTFRQLPDPSRYYKNSNSIDLDLYDNRFSDIPTESKLDLLHQSIAEIEGRDNRITSITASYDDGAGSEYMIASNGFEGESIDSAYSLSVEVAIKTDGDARIESFWYDSSIYWDDLLKKGIAAKALERAQNKVGQQKIDSGKYAMLVDNTMSSRILSPLIGAMYGSALQQKNSFLIDKLGQAISSPILSLTDMPHLKRCFGSRWFDGEGVATSERDIINGGILSTYFIDTYNSLKLGVKPTIASPSVIVAKTGKHNFDEMCKSLHKGIWVTGFNGGNCNSTTGDFSYGIEGFLIENGQPVKPISEMNITGNMLTLWQSLVEVGNDLRMNSSRRLPSMLFENVNFNGL